MSEPLVIDENLRVDPGKACKKRVADIKPILPRSYRQILFSNYPEYQQHYGAQLLNNVMNLRAADMRLTEILEKIAKGELQLKNKAS